MATHVHFLLKLLLFSRNVGSLCRRNSDPSSIVSNRVRQYSIVEMLDIRYRYSPTIVQPRSVVRAMWNTSRRNHKYKKSKSWSF